MIIDWLEYEKKDHVFAWILVESMSEYGIDEFKDFDPSKLDVKLEINGIEVDVIKAMDDLQAQLTDIHESGIKEGIEQAYYKIDAAIKDKLAESFDIAL